MAPYRDASACAPLHAAAEAPPATSAQPGTDQPCWTDCDSSHHHRRHGKTDSDAYSNQNGTLRTITDQAPQVGMHSCRFILVKSIGMRICRMCHTTHSNMASGCLFEDNSNRLSRHTTDTCVRHATSCLQTSGARLSEKAAAKHQLGMEKARVCAARQNANSEM